MNWNRLKTVLSWILRVCGLLLGLLGTHQLILPIFAWLVPSLDPVFYDWAVFGAYRTHNYVTFNVKSPDVNRLLWDDECDGGFVLITPSGRSVVRPGPMILDGRGELVWASDQFGSVMNLKMQQYQGKNHLTFWAGHRDSSSGQGAYYMLDEKYEIVHQIHVVGDGLKGDLHEFQITADGTALVTSYQQTQVDLTSIGRPVDGWISDSLFQEIDIATGNLLFEWRASDHFDAAESHMTHPLAGYWEAIPFDFFHINSVDKDSSGNYLISSRHLHMVATIDKSSGEVLWALGGERNQFVDLSDGAATGFKWQHDARWVSEEEGILTLFDNEEAGILHIEAPYSKAMMLRLDVANSTVELVQSYVSAHKTRAPSQGSVQALPNARLFVGWGHSPAYSEFDVGGALVCETHFGASMLDFWNGVASYRAQKVADWVGAPDSDPVAKISHSHLYISWNGATEVAAWEVEGAMDGQDFETIDVIDKTGFEGSFILDEAFDFDRYRVAALDEDGKILGYSEEVDAVEERKAAEIVLWLIPIAAVLSAANFLCMKLRGRSWLKLGVNSQNWRYRALK